MKSTLLRIKNKIKKSPLYWRTLIVLLIIALIIKLTIIYISYKNLNPWENIISYTASDIIILLFVQLLLTLNYCIKNRKLRLINDLIVFIILVIFLVDMFTIYFFQSRISISDAFILSSNWSSWFSGKVFLRVLVSVCLWIITFLWIQKLNNYKWNERKTIVIISSSCIIIYSLFYINLKIFNVNVDPLDNIITLNIHNIKQSNVENLEAEDNKDLSYEDYISLLRWKWKDLNIILVFAESLSAIDSANMGWNDKLPWVDEIQKDWITFTNFIENWATSDTAHIATLYGTIPLINIWSNDSPYTGYRLVMKPLPEYLNTQWYNTTFISAASLNFLNQIDFLSWVWFQKIIWEEEFQSDKKYTFDAAPDGDLYDRALQEVQAQTWKYFIWLQTISFHKPYNTPYWKTEELALKYSDDELYRFYQNLKDTWFFDSGILVILGDHRKMNAAEDWEYETFWPNRYTRSVATVVWSWINPWEINWNIIQHTDFYNSLKILVWSWNVEVDKTYNDIFSKNANRKRWITSARYFTKNKYTVSILWETWFTFNNISIFSGDKEIYNHLISYIKFELWNEENLYHKDRTIFIWHQWARKYTTENTLQSFMIAKNQWARGIEFDVSYTKDKHNIVAHGEYFYGSNCQNFKIMNCWYDWINENCTLDNWEKYKDLWDMLELIDWLFDYYFLEIKVDNEKRGKQQTLDAIQTVKDHNMQDRVIFISYSDTAKETLNSDPDIIYGRDTYNVTDLNFIWENNSKYFLVPQDMITPEIVEKAKAIWKEVVTYTVNETWDFQTMKNLWIDIILTDRIDLLQFYDNIVIPLLSPQEQMKLKKSSKTSSEDLES